MFPLFIQYMLKINLNFDLDSLEKASLNKLQITNSTKNTILAVTYLTHTCLTYNFNLHWCTKHPN
jgi:hypothetical protein